MCVAYISLYIYIRKEGTRLHIAVFAFVYQPLLVGVHPAHIQFCH